MKIILANPRGFCAGVNMAIESLETALDLFGAPLYVYHEIVHNKYVVERFKRQGVVFVETLDEVPRGRAAALQRPRRLARRSASRPAEREPPRHRRHLPARDQGPPRGRQVRQRGLHDRPHRPRGARRGHRHDGRGPRQHGPGRDRRGRRARSRSARPTPRSPI